MCRSADLVSSMHLPTAGWGAPKPRVAVDVLNPGAPNAPVPSVPPSLGWVLPNNEVCPALRATRRGEGEKERKESVKNQDVNVFKPSRQLRQGGPSLLVLPVLLPTLELPFSHTEQHRNVFQEQALNITHILKHVNDLSHRVSLLKESLLTRGSSTNPS